MYDTMTRPDLLSGLLFENYTLRSVQKLHFVQFYPGRLFRDFRDAKNRKNVGQWDKILNLLVSVSCLSQGCPRLSQVGTKSDNLGQSERF